ncbi:MAG: hypothetical protein U0531_17810 [Dehalococcoidia bacterium]
MDLDAVVIPVEAHWHECRLVGAVQHGIADKLLQRRQQVRLAALLKRAARQVNVRAVVRHHLLIYAAQHLGQHAVKRLLIDDRVVKLVAGDAQELQIGAGQKVARSRSKHEHTKHGRNRLVDRDDHLGRRKPLVIVAVIGGEDIPCEGAGQVGLFE